MQDFDENTGESYSDDPPRAARRPGGRRYIDTFFRHAWICLLPVFVFPLAALGVVKETGKTATVGANVWVNQYSTKHLSYSDPLATPAANVAAALLQLLQTTSFDLQVAKESPLYWATVAGRSDADVAAVTDLSGHVTVATNGPDLVSVTYIHKQGSVGIQLMQNILKEAPREISRLNQQQAASSIALYQHEKKTVQKHLASATRDLGSYVKKHHISPSQMAEQALFDPTFATLYQAVQSSEVALQHTDDLLSQASPQLSSGSTIQVIDSPSLRPSSTGKKTLVLDMGIGLVLGLFLSGLFVVWKTASDPSLRNPQEVEELVGLPILACVPYTGKPVRKHGATQTGDGR